MTHSDNELDLQDLLNNAGWLRRLALRLVGPEGADDLVQDTFVLAMKGKPPGGKGLRPWIGRVLRNRSIDLQRADARRTQREKSLAKEEVQPASDQLAERAEAMRMLATAVEKLPPTQRNVILLRYFEDKQPAEIGVLLGMPASTVRSHLTRGMQSLRVSLDADRDRASWMQALAPLTFPNLMPAAPAVGKAIFLSTLISMGTTLKTAVILVSVLALGWFGYQQVGKDKQAGETNAASIDSSDTNLKTDDGKAEEIIGSTGSQRAPVIEQQTQTGAIIEGVLLDSDTGEPVRSFALGLKQGPAPELPTEPWPQPKRMEGLEEVVTDSNGRFASEKLYLAGQYHAVLVEDWNRFEVFDQGVPDFDWPRKGLGFQFQPSERVELQVAAGCHYEIDCPQASALGLENFLVQFNDSETPNFHSDGWSLILDWKRPFVRYPVLDEPDYPRNRLHLVAKDGSWFASAKVPRCQGPSSEPVRFEIQQCGGIGLRVETNEPPFTDGVLFSSFPGDLTLEQMSGLKSAWSMISGGFGGAPRSGPVSFGMEFQPLGEQTIRVRTAGFADEAVTIDVQPGKAQEVTVLLRRTEQATGKITGLVRAGEAGPPAHEVIVQMTEGKSGGASMRAIEVKWAQEQGDWIGRFEIENLYDREYRLLLTPGMSVPRKGLNWSPKPRAHTVRPNGPVLEFQIGEGPALGRFEVRVVDAKSGEAIWKFNVMAFVQVEGSGEQDPVEGKDGLAKLRLPGDPSKVSLLAYAEGYAPGHLYFSAPVDKGGISKNTIRMTPGWGASVFVVDKSAKPGVPMEGVRVFADGVDMGVTDEKGQAWVIMNQRAGKIEVRKDGFEIASRSGPIDEAGALTEPLRGAPIDGFVFGLKAKE